MTHNRTTWQTKKMINTDPQKNRGRQWPLVRQNVQLQNSG